MTTTPILYAPERRGLCRSGTHDLENYPYRSPDAEVRAGTSADGTITIEGYAVVWNRYSSNLGGYVEQIDPGAFDDSLVNDDQIASYNHDYASILGRRSAGNRLVLTKDSTGLRYTINGAPTDPDVVRVAEKVRAGSVVGSSFTFRSMPDGETWSYTPQDYPLVTVVRASLYEVAPVVWPAYPATTEDDLAVALRSLSEQLGRAIELGACSLRQQRLREFLESTSERDTPAIESLRRRARWREVSA